IATAPEKVEQARSGMLEELTRLVEQTLSAQELEHAKRNLTGNHAISQQRNSGHAAHMALDGLYGLGPGTNQHYAKKVDRVTRKDVVRVAQRVVTLDAYTEALVAP
ncbi:MAG: insulinase family protein, partial [bacterium]|nr:insulinase family protein [bacterium]